MKIPCWDNPSHSPKMLKEATLDRPPWATTCWKPARTTRCQGDDLAHRDGDQREAYLRMAILWQFLCIFIGKLVIHQPWDFSGTPFFDSLIWVKIKQITMRQQRQTHSRNSRHVFLFQQWWASASCNISCQIYSLTTVCDKYIQLRYCVNCICIWYHIKVQLCFFLWFNAENIKPSVSTFLVTCRSACWKHHRFLMHVACCCMWQ